MIAPRVGRAGQRVTATESVRRVGPLPWYLSMAEGVGFDVDLVDDIVGDIVEECAGSSAPLAVRTAWSAGQILRALPHLAVSTLRRGQPRARVRLLGAFGVLLLAATSMVAVPRLRVGPPARITTDRGFDANDIVINNVDFVQMPLHALDAYGHTVAKAAIGYEFVSGDPIDISANGAVSCRSSGDAVVRASVNDLASLVTVHCRPVTRIRTMQWQYDFLPGDSPQVLRIDAVGADGRRVRDVRGSLSIADTTIATLRRNVLRPRGAGSTRLTIAVGDARANIAVVVHEFVDRFDNLAPTQRDVAMPLRLAPGDTLHLPVPAGTMWVKWMARDGGTSHPAITAEGPGWCHMDSEAFLRWAPAGEYRAYCYVSEGTRIRIARGSAGEPVLTGALLLERLSR